MHNKSGRANFNNIVKKNRWYSTFGGYYDAI